ncbi:esterase [Flavobacteriaceae bacterium TP-CH-4]|uniref:Esterase n=1 Tax=Pelagihabitans pacificus TaxID=2696054 RepID=A0A967ASE8_9FLAO|nr:esterase [Pelagihabitans pacificus]NHF59244.1 esterase [Pelagihabitans pacificus]
MASSEKQTRYTTTNTYSVLNSLGDGTRNVWVVLHGIGYLSRYFLKYFEELPKEENYIIAPQAPSKYYLNGEYKHVGASWLTKENTIDETENIMNYLDAVLEAENLPLDRNLIVFGFSQGVSIATRWVAKRKVACRQLVLYAGGIPDELSSSDFAVLEKNKTQVTIIVGDKDEYLTEERRKLESDKISKLFRGRAKEIIFKGGHEIKKELINQLA